MNDEFEDGEIVTLEDLLEDGRYEEVEQILAHVPDDDPDSAWALSLRALCLVHLRRDDDAFALARIAVGRSPDSAFAWWTLGSLLSQRNRFDDALTAAQRAVALDPADVRCRGLLAQVHALRGEWGRCREAAEAGLALDPTDEACSNLQALALRATTSSGDAWPAAVEDLVRRYPASGWARAGRGWSLLEAGRAHDARADFEQAVALDPTSEWARDGLIEAMKAANPLYAALLRLFLWLDRLPTGTRWTIILGGIFAFRVLRRATEANPSIAIATYPLMAAWILFIVSSWTAVPLSDFIMARTPVGRRLITPDRKLAGNLVAGLLVAAVAAGVVFAITGAQRAAETGLACAFLMIPASGVFQCSRGWPRTAMAAWTSVAAVATAAVAFAPADIAGAALGVAIIMSVLGSWVATFLSSRTPAR